MPQAALLIVDVQKALVDGNPYRRDAFLADLSRLLILSQQKGIEPIYIQHDGGPGDELEAGTTGWEIADAIAPGKEAKVFSKRKNSAFKETGLHAYLQERGMNTLILVGMQTEYCIDATCKAAFDLDYSLIIPRGCTTTFDNDFFKGEALSRYYETKIWHGRFAQVVSPEEAVKLAVGDC